MTYQHLKAEIDRCKEIAQSFLNYKQGYCTFDDFVMFAMEQNKGGAGRNDKYARDFFESLRDKEFNGGSNSALAGLMDYDSIFGSVIGNHAMVNEQEADMIWSYGSRYFMQAKKSLVA